MTSALVRRELSRAKLEALAWGQCILDPFELPAILLERLDPASISPALRQLLEQLSVLEGDIDELRTETHAQLAITDRALALTLEDVRGIGAFSIDTLVALLNRLPSSKPIPERAWQRQLAEAAAT